ncbi:hypothetical protein B0H17DRAFT_1132694 [Mycena rosella]|uniref:Uncharacterized protein n=1 Tax=Mycena rosella TaxID=1033263 RepID=A0AAD7DK44_MYCRO|nr:hypothetical protein B0H17DRAFT_1132694 [Mycena rosella]
MDRVHGGLKKRRRRIPRKYLDITEEVSPPSAYQDILQKIWGKNKTQSLQIGQELVEKRPCALLGVKKKLFPPFGSGSNSQQFLIAASVCVAIGHSNRTRYLQNLAAAYDDRYRKLDHLEDIEKALQYSFEALDRAPEGHSDRAICLQNVGRNIIDRYKKLKRPEDLELIPQYFLESAKMRTGNPALAWRNLFRWASFSASYQPEHCVAAFNGMFNLLPELLWIGQMISVRQDAIHQLDIPDKTATATKTCIIFQKLRAAVEIMEQELGTLYQQMLQLKMPVDDLPREQAQKFRNYSMQLYRQGSDPTMNLVNERNTLIEAIRKQKGFEFFLLPKPYDVLRHTAQGGPVILLNSHEECCDGIIILNSTAEPVHVSFYEYLCNHL